MAEYSFITELGLKSGLSREVAGGGSLSLNLVCQAFLVGRASSGLACNKRKGSGLALPLTCSETKERGAMETKRASLKSLVQSECVLLEATVKVCQPGRKPRKEALCNSIEPHL
ncbi:hypothetical protein CEXT_112021 [Caerostris extrusa]|uniref:Uncharacterized protein n=1 Tax=Caerostris extrusa TaxID=172846 RepID=A0AAV4M8X0_CAEEX|nr:hypothetical protein CEXT_112021 [Caerostris extrusa]